MGIFNDIKKIFWANKSIAKSAAGKVTDAAKEKGEELSEMADEYVDHAKEKAGDLGDRLRDKASDAMDKASDFTENVGSTILTTGGVLADKAKNSVEDLGAKVTGKESEAAPITEDTDILEEIMKERREKAAAESAATAETVAENEESIFMTKEEMAKGKISKSLDSAKALGADLSKTAMDKGGDILGKVKNTAADISDKLEANPAVQKAAEVSEKVGDKVLDTGEKFMDKLGEVSEKVGGEVLDKGGKAVDKFGDMAEGVGSKILAAKDDLMAKAEAEAAKSGDNMDSLTDRAKDLGQKLEDKITGKIDFEKDFADTPIDVGESELNKHGSFWDKAEKYADGNYSMEEKKAEGELTIQDNPEYQAKLNEGKVKGFDDLDGDGNELIDDAIIEED
jgi:ElaB/YqjD/DUF883 family membrane-anchored ribosome-binding protein